MSLTNLPQIEAVLADFDQRATPFDRMDVMSALNTARQSLGTLPDED